MNSLSKSEFSKLMSLRILIEFVNNGVEFVFVEKTDIDLRVDITKLAELVRNASQNRVLVECVPFKWIASLLLENAPHKRVVLHNGMNPYKKAFVICESFDQTEELAGELHMLFLEWVS